MLNKIPLLAVLFLAVLILLPATAVAECDPFPRYKIWGNLTHGKVQSYVDRKLDGDWQPYLSHLEKQLAGVKGIMARGKPARIRYKGKLVNLVGDDLVDYVRLSEARLDVAQCLAEESEIAGLNDFSTAAGGGEPADTEIKNVAQYSGANALKLAVETACDNGNSVFKITNRGANWPSSGTLSIYRMGEGRRDVINSRRLRLKAGQLATFRVKAKSNPTGRLGLFVKPSWYERPFDYDATMRCRYAKTGTSIDGPGSGAIFFTPVTGVTAARPASGYKRGDDRGKTRTVILEKANRRKRRDAKLPA